MTRFSDPRIPDSTRVLGLTFIDWNRICCCWFANISILKLGLYESHTGLGGEAKN